MKKFAKILVLSAVAALCANVCAHAEYMLSNNNFYKENNPNNNDYQIYEQTYGTSLEKKDTGADYTWTEGSDATAISTDTASDGSSLQKLRGGRINRYDGAYVINSTYDDYKCANKYPSTVQFDLKDIYAVNRVDVIAVSTYQDQLGPVKISVSKDGESFSEVGSFEAYMPAAEEVTPTETNKKPQTMGNTKCIFETTAARYVRISFEKAAKSATEQGCRKYIVQEIVIMGDDYVELSADNIHYEDMLGEEATTITDTDYITASADIKGGSGVFVTARYGKDKRLKKLYTSNGSGKLKNKVSSSDFDKGDYLKSFALSSYENMIPIGNYETFVPAEMTESALITGSNPEYSVCTGYEWSADITETDLSLPNAEKLFDADTKTVSEISTEKDVGLKIHFDRLMQLDKVSIYDKRTSSANVKQYDLYASTDGINYEWVGEQKISKPNLGSVIRLDMLLDGAAVYATDVKIVLKKGTSASKLNIAEVQIYGRSPEFKPERKTAYSYNTEMPFASSGDITEADSTCTALSIGSANLSSSGDYVSLIYDFNEIAQLEEAVIDGEYSGGEISYSIDNCNWYTSAYFAGASGANAVKGKAQSNARYIKLVLSKGDLEKILLNEIKVYTRDIYNADAEKSEVPEAVKPKAYLKPNNVLYLDWSSYNYSKNNVTGYGVYIEKTNFANASGYSPKNVYVGNNPRALQTVTVQFCAYAALEPDTDYYIAVVPITATTKNTNVSCIKVRTNSALGGETLAGMFCIGEYPYGGSKSIRLEHTEENCGFTESENLQKKLKLINAMGTFQRTKYWSPTEILYNLYFANGLGMNTRLNSPDSAADVIDTANRMGTYLFGTENEPDLESKTYLKNPGTYVSYLKSVSDILKEKSPNSMLCAPATCGTEKLWWYDKIYETAQSMGYNLGDMYDVVDVHAYCKVGGGETDGKNDGEYGYDDNLGGEAETIPEHLFAKVEKIRKMLAKYNDNDKDIVFTELGWSTHTQPQNETHMEAVSKERQANFVARAYLIGSILGVKNIYSYSFQDENKETDNAEYQFGMVDWYAKPKPAYYAYYTLSRILKNASLVGRIDTLVHPAYGAVYFDSEKDMYVTALWSANGSKTVNMQTAAETVLKTDIYGNSEYISPNNIQIGSAPVYIYTKDMPTVSQ